MKKYLMLLGLILFPFFCHATSFEAVDVITDASGNIVIENAQITDLTASRLIGTGTDKTLSSNVSLTSGVIPKASGTGSLADSSFNQDASNNLVVPGLRNTGLTASVPIETNSDKVLTSGTKTGTGSAYVMDTSPTITNAQLTNPALGTPASGVATNLTGTAAGLTAGTVTTNANMTGPITGTGNVTSITSQTGTGTKFVVDTSPTIKGAILDTSTNLSYAVANRILFTSSNKDISVNANLAWDGSTLQVGSVIPLSVYGTYGVAAASVYLAGSNATFTMDSQGSAADNRIWGFHANNDSTFTMDIGNDAGSIASNWLKVTRSGTTVSNVAFPNGNVRMSAYGAGAATFDASGNITSVSDERLKNIQGFYIKGLKEILQLEPINYKWNEKSGLEQEHTYTGFSAQRVQKVIPEAVGQNKEGMLTLQDRTLIATLVNAIKELKAENDKLKKRIRTLEKKIK